MVKARVSSLRPVRIPSIQEFVVKLANFSSAFALLWISFCFNWSGVGSYNGVFPTPDVSYSSLQQQVFGDGYGMHSQVRFPPRSLSMALVLAT